MTMVGATKIDRIVAGARQGDQAYIDQLVELAWEKVFGYLFEITCDHQIAEEITQETLIDLLGSLFFVQFVTKGSLCAWLYRTAFERLQNHVYWLGEQCV